MNQRLFKSGGGLTIFVILSALLIILIVTQHLQMRKEIHLALYDWEDDIPNAVLDAFTEETGIKVDYFTYESQEEMADKLRQGFKFDVVVVENQWIPKLRDEGLLSRIDLTKVPNSHNISENFRNLAFDPGNQYSIPYSWGITDLIVRRDGPAPSRFSDVANMAGKIGLRDEPQDIIGLTLLSLGYPANSESPDELAEAEEWLKKIQPNVVRIEPEGKDGIEKLASKEIDILIGWGGDLFFAKQMHVPVSCIVPQEGSIFWGDSFIIPMNNNHQEMAEIFINFLLLPEISARIANHTAYPSANAAAFPFITDELKSDSSIYPDAKAIEEMIRNGEFLLPLSPEGEKRYKNIWDQFMNGISKID